MCTIYSKRILLTHRKSSQNSWHLFKTSIHSRILSSAQKIYQQTITATVELIVWFWIERKKNTLCLHWLNGDRIARLEITPYSQVKNIVRFDFNSHIHTATAIEPYKNTNTQVEQYTFRTPLATNTSIAQALIHGRRSNPWHHYTSPI